MLERAGSRFRKISRSRFRFWRVESTGTSPLRRSVCPGRSSALAAHWRESSGSPRVRTAAFSMESGPDAEGAVSSS
jgi:hypothetical protein